jgi:hypothetical protein
MGGGIPLINSCKLQCWKNIKQKLQHVISFFKNMSGKLLKGF